MSNVLLGLSNNISLNLNKIKVWSGSFKKHCPDGEVVLLCANSTPEDLKACEDIGVKAVLVEVKDEHTINHQRLIHIKDYLLQRDEKDLFLISDVFDVLFQTSPFDLYDLENHDVYVGEEGVDVHEEPWNFSNIGGLFPKALNLCLQHPVVCSGIIGGKRDALIKLYTRMYVMCEEESTNAHNIKDQAALIVMLAKNEVERVKIFKLKDGWSVHCAVAGPTQFFELWGFKNKLVSKGTPIPYMEDGVVKTERKAYAMVHQFNRIPEWNLLLTQPYL